MSNSLVPRVLLLSNFCLKVLINTLNFKMFLGSSDELQNVPMFINMNFKMFLGSSYITVRWIYGFIHESCSSCELHKVLGPMPLQICLETCAGERKVELPFHAHVLYDFVGLLLYQLLYVSNSDWMRLELSFCFCFCTNCIVMSLTFRMFICFT